MLVLLGPAKHAGEFRPGIGRTHVHVTKQSEAVLGCTQSPSSEAVDAGPSASPLHRSIKPRITALTADRLTAESPIKKTAHVGPTSRNYETKPFSVRRVRELACMVGWLT